MKGKRLEVVWGLLLVLLGAIFFAEQTGVLPDFARTTWMIVLAGISVLFFAGYLLNGWRQWGLLLPATVAGSLSLIIWMTEDGRNDLLAGSLLMAAVSLPFWVAFAADRQRHWWAFIPGWATAALALVILLSEQVRSEFLGSFVMFAVGLPFLAVYLFNRKNRWALIPAFVLFVIGLVVLMSTAVGDEWIGALVLAAIAMPFLFVYFRTPAQWWAIIPGGVLTTLALVVLFSMMDASQVVVERLLGSLFFAGLAATFAVVWWRHQQAETRWARYPAAGLAFMALLVLIFGSLTEILWPLALVAVGLWLLYNNLGYRPQLKG